MIAEEYYHLDPLKWTYNEFFEAKKEVFLIWQERKDITFRDTSGGLFGACSYDRLRNSYKGWMEEYLEEGAKTRQDEWTRSIAVGNMPFVENVKALL